MNTETLIIGALLFFAWQHEQKGSSSGGAGGGASADVPTRVGPSTTTRVVDNKATDAGSTAVELANDGKIILTDGLDIASGFKDLFGSSDA